MSEDVVRYLTFKMEMQHLEALEKAYPAEQIESAFEKAIAVIEARQEAEFYEAIKKFLPWATKENGKKWAHLVTYESRKGALYTTWNFYVTIASVKRLFYVKVDPASLILDQEAL
jgi:hypothetical protein